MSTSSSPYADSSVSVTPPPLPLPQKTDKKPNTHVPWTRHALKQLKLVLPGAALTYYLGTIHTFLSVLHGSAGSWARTGAIVAAGLGLITITLFSYVLLLPWFTGEKPNYKTWRDSGILSSVIPALTSSIVIGWLVAVSTLGQWSSLGYVNGIIGVSAFYALTFGLLGLVPTRRIASSKKPQ
ncbi:hypothetical protein BYT27DRAFT_7096144 [Phlegmacium glaucopus]|nr:hypothetical protein BYT27DRAFT_7096144 [Phlegmacium glaucopus]